MVLPDGPHARSSATARSAPRSRPPSRCAGWLEELGWEVRLQPFDPHFVHIDVIVNVVAPGLAVICEECAPPGLADWLRSLGLELIDGRATATCMELGANVMCAGRATG